MKRKKNKLVGFQLNHGTVVFIATFVILHAGVDDVSNRTIDVIRANILQKVDYFATGRLAKEKQHSQFWKLKLDKIARKVP